MADDLPRYAEALGRRKQKLLLLTTAILSPSTPHAEKILRTAKKLGVTHYRLGYWSYKNQPDRAKLQAEVRAQLKDLAALTCEIGMKGVYQHCGEQHLHRYLAEFDFRYGSRSALGVNDTDRAEKLLLGVVGKRLTYQTIN